MSCKPCQRILDFDLPADWVALKNPLAARPKGRAGSEGIFHILHVRDLAVAKTVDLAEFDRIVTHGDGAVGVQIAQPIGRLVVRRGIETCGGTGQSLVSGVLQTLSAIALSIKPGGSAQSIEIDGGLKTNGNGVAPIEIDGSVAVLNITGGVTAASGNH